MKDRIPSVCVVVLDFNMLRFIVGIKSKMYFDNAWLNAECVGDYTVERHLYIQMLHFIFFTKYKLHYNIFVAKDLHDGVPLCLPK